MFSTTNTVERLKKEIPKRGIISYPRGVAWSGGVEFVKFGEVVPGRTLGDLRWVLMVSDRPAATFGL